PGKGTLPARVISPEEVGVEHRGKGRNQRLVHNILPDSGEADCLLVVEVYTEEGATSSWPAHKHDTPVPGKETQLEETYYHRFDPPQGFAFQRVYTDDRSLDACMAPYNHDVVMVPRGYHPVAAIAGYDSYYLNVMAGPERQWLFTWEEDHAWINSDDYPRR
ncbi:5-deoxy-glucuronate isomerase, partial [Cronobacter sakazakii]